MTRLTKILLSCLSAFLAALGVSADQGDIAVEVECAGTLIVGAPAIVTVTICNRGASSFPSFVPKIDFASEIDQGVALAFRFEAESGTAIQVGCPMYGLPELEVYPRPPRVALNAGERVTLAFDLNQLLFGGELREGKSVPPGTYRMTAMFFYGRYTSSPRAITVREPTSAEKQFFEAIQRQEVGKRWFPAAIVDDNLEVPEDTPLPPETALLREFIKLLRLALRDPEAAVKRIEDKNDSWGYLQGTVAELKYECVAKSKGIASPAAQEMRRALEADVKTKGQLTRLEKAGGVLDHFAAIKAAKPRGK